MSVEAQITALAQAVAADIKAQSTALAGKEPSLPDGGNSGHYLRGDKTWGVTGTAVRTAVLTGLGSGTNTPISATDTVLAAFAGLQAQVSAREATVAAGASTDFYRGDKTWQNFGSATRAQLLTGLGTPTNTAIAAADTILAAFAKLQGQVTARMTNPMTTAGDMIRGGTSGAPERVAAGTNGYVWTMVAGVPGWAAAAAGGGVGISQTWQNMTASRALATTYTNSTGVPIAVEVTLMSVTSGQLSITPTVDGVSLGQTIYPAGASGFAFSRAFIVPPGSTYSIGTDSSSATPSLSRWVELRA